MGLTNYIPRTTIQHSRHLFLKDRCPQDLAKLTENHPFITLGEISALDLEKYNINTNETHYLCSQISHSLHLHQKNTMDLGNQGQSQMSSKFFLLSQSTINDNLRPKSTIFLKDKNNDNNQEEKSMKEMANLRESGANLAVDVYAQGNITHSNISINDIRIYESRSQKALAFSRITNNTYDETTGALLSMPVIVSSSAVNKTMKSNSPSRPPEEPPEPPTVIE